VNREWNATSYHKVSGTQTSWGQRVLARLELRGDERAIDAGCGSVA
jgi:trans-aconitate 2-methyltransferase